MDEVTRLRMRRAHAGRSVVCDCGRRVWGNGSAAHKRTCTVHLEKSGWPLDDRMRQALFDELPGKATDTLIEVQRRLGRFYLARRAQGDKSTLPWREYRDLVWQYVDDVEAGR